jgi:hypothetical protein
MTTPEMRRCKKCNALEINECTGKWCCSLSEEEDNDIHSIPDEDCPLEQDW